MKSEQRDGQLACLCLLLSKFKGCFSKWQRQWLKTRFSTSGCLGEFLCSAKYGQQEIQIALQDIALVLAVQRWMMFSHRSTLFPCLLATDVVYLSQDARRGFYKKY